jgi:hypothetical protein
MSDSTVLTVEVKSYRGSDRAHRLKARRLKFTVPFSLTLKLHVLVFAHIQNRNVAQIYTPE